MTVPLASGYTYCVQVQAVDLGGNTSPWRPVRCTTRPVDDRGLATSAGWSRLHGAADYARTISQSQTLNATLKKAATFRRLAVVVTTCPTGGSISVYSRRW